MANKETSSQNGHAAGRDVIVHTGPSSSVSAIHGGTNFIGNQGTVNVHIVEGPKRRSRPPEEDYDPCVHIGPEQQIALRGLCNDWVALHAKIKRSAMTHQTAWMRINSTAGARSYTLIRQDRYNAVVTYVKQQMAMLSNMKSAAQKDDGWRNKKIGAIKARCKNQFAGADIYKPYIKKNFNAESLADLATDQLQKTYAYVMAKKAAVEVAK